MNTNLAAAKDLSRAVCEALRDSPTQVHLFPPFPYLLPVAGVIGDAASPVLLGAQDAFFSPNGAFTGEVSVDMLIDCGVRAVLTGHSERRHVIGESDDIVNAKTLAVLAKGLTCVLCIGETLNQRERGETDSINAAQLTAALAGVPTDHLSRLVIAYEPVWAIGTGKNATPDDAQDAHHKIRALLRTLFGAPIADATRIQYGGSVKASNARDLMAMPDIDGALVGGASLKADEFAQIVRACGS
ncbi:MAG: triose-phosphate isomerase [Phycisphaeraceae bacterium]|nr:triose-phosphate isomerase [Phycisphaeraceae bacterium]